MDLRELTVGEAVLRAENGVLELFQLGADGSLGPALTWVAVRTQPGKRQLAGRMAQP